MKHLKEEFDKLTFKEVLLYSLSIATMVAAFVLLFLGLFIPPEGQIHDSVLTAFAFILLFVGAMLGINMHYANQLSIFKEKIYDIMRKESQNAPPSY